MISDSISGVSSDFANTYVFSSERVDFLLPTKPSHLFPESLKRIHPPKNHRENGGTLGMVH